MRSETGDMLRCAGPQRMTDLFAVSGGSVCGRDHVLAGRDCQDAFFFAAERDCLIAVVADGCGSERLSGIGAHIGVRLLAQAIVEQLRRAEYDVQDFADGILPGVERNVLDELAQLAACMTVGDTPTDVVAAYFLFTVLGFVVVRETAVVFGIGDGLYAINGNVQQLGPFPGNAPPYVAYGLQGRQPGLQVYATVPTARLDSLLIGTDGVVDLMKLSEVDVPGRSERVGGLSQFWEDDRYVGNADAVRRRLAVLNRDVQTPLWNEQRIQRRHGLLHDDTTLVVARRKQAPA